MTAQFMDWRVRIRHSRQIFKQLIIQIIFIFIKNKNSHCLHYKFCGKFANRLQSKTTHAPHNLLGVTQAAMLPSKKISIRLQRNRFNTDGTLAVSWCQLITRLEAEAGKQHTIGENTQATCPEIRPILPSGSLAFYRFQ
jgi:hypothetical protein